MRIFAAIMLVALCSCRGLIIEPGTLSASEQAELAFQSGNFEQAVDFFSQSLNEIPQEDSESRSVIVRKLANSYYEWAIAEAFRGREEKTSGYYVSALEHCHMAAATDPARQKKFDALAEKLRREQKDVSYERMLELAKLDPEGRERKAEIALFSAQAKQLLDAGQLMRARDKFNSVLALDPYNQDAIFQLKRIVRKSHAIAKERRELQDRERLAEAEWRYVQAVKTGNTQSDNPGSSQPSSPPSIEQRLDSIYLPFIQFNETTLMDVFRTFTVKSHLPEAPGGVKFRFDGCDPRSKDWPTITFSAEEISLRDAVDAVCQAVGLQWQVDNDAIVLKPIPEKN